MYVVLVSSNAKADAFLSPYALAKGIHDSHQNHSNTSRSYVSHFLTAGSDLKFPCWVSLAERCSANHGHTAPSASNC